MKMINSKYFSNVNVQKLIIGYAKVSSNLTFQRNASNSGYHGPATETELEKTAKYYDTIATQYITAVDILSIGLHRIWRKALANNVEISRGTKIIDAASGTGLNTLKLLEKSRRLKLDSDFQITMFDMNPYMMKIGQKTFKKLGYNANLVEYVEGDLHKLPFDDETFNTAMISLANRPHVDFSSVLLELNRVLKPQGKIVLMDVCFSQNPNFLQRMHINYVEHIGSKLEKLILGNLGAADFVLESLREVVAKSDVEQMLKNAKFHNIEFQPLTLGLAEVTVAYKL